MFRSLLDRWTRRKLPLGAEEPWYSEAMGLLDPCPRHVVVLIPRAPCLAWIRTLGGEWDAVMTLDEIRKDLNAYLVPVTEDHDSEMARFFVDDHYGHFFAQELEQWSLDRACWPAKRTLAMFHQWYDVVVHGMVLDTALVPTIDRDGSALEN